MALVTEEGRSEEARRLLWTVARTAPPEAELVDAVVAAAGRLGPDGWTAAGVLLRRALRPLDALDAFDRAAREAAAQTDPPPAVEAGLLLAELRADALALKRLAEHPRHPAAMYGAAFVLARAGRRSEALERVEALLRVDPNQPAARLLRVELLDSLGRGGEALGSLRELAGTAGPDSPAAYRLGRMLARQGSADEALDVLTAVVEADPDNPDAWLALARVLRDSDRSEEAADAFRRALEHNPGLNEARFGLAQLVARRGESEAAGRLFQEFERRKAVAEESARLLGEAELEADDFSRVAAFVRHALGSGEFGLALRGAQRFLVEAPDEFERHLLLARVFSEVGRLRDAERVVRRGLERFPGRPEAVRRFEAALVALERRGPR